ncbi:MAG: hypothetical protein NTV49_13630 [Kiritimatiellaeota bacterium]|nr:hypothetical protein [Kiritimatiellota bacterium]
MKFIRVLAMVCLGGAVFAILQLPDPLSDRPETAYVRLPDYDFSAAAAADWKAGRRSAALLLADVGLEQPVAGRAEARRLREDYRAELQKDKSPLGALQVLGLGPEPGGVNWFESLAGNSVADFFVYGGGLAAGATTEQDALLRLLRETQPVAAAFPAAAPALQLIGTARLTKALNPRLAQQLTEALQFARATANSGLALAAVQESVMPVYQLARQCKSWAEFALLLNSAESVDQVKMLTRMASAAPRSARKLAQILAVSDAQEGDLAARGIGFVMQQGVKGLDSLHAALRKGPAGLALVLNHPALPVPALNKLRPSASPLLGAAGNLWWLDQLQWLGALAVWGKYLVVALLCGAIMALLLPWRLFRDKFVNVTPLANAPAERVRGIYWSGIALAAVALSLLLLLPAVAPTSSPAGEAAGPGGGAGPGGAASGFLEQNQTVSLLILLVVILIVQGTCWWLARRKLREIEQDGAADAALKLKRLENLDIFFDLPLYCGLALTILAFILITTFGAGVSRFLAYAATFVGIVFSVILRVGHLYPLREKLLNQKGSAAP